MGQNKLRKVGRPKKVIHYPSYNFTYLMYDITDKKTKKTVRVLGCSEAQARAAVKFEKVKIKPTKIKQLTDQLGHHETHVYLKKFGEQWICKEGNLFFKELT